LPSRRWENPQAERIAAFENRREDVSLVAKLAIFPVHAERRRRSRLLPVDL